ncbi:polysaccharide deacetylase family protein [Klenkia brasiliensis]|uniref:Peptidoglycan/xylan/chitin deacetylase, PgdA/CDA1 family n=1 Tax=Klenkia brasiliensis TaxID=333142 RepID=A0A1G7LES6_9ACTN|nr:polysaccharide deacetylase family protein [Klenkia brasiliensis]SDF47988.1 Peptidoglycan/xylan/chitin deacetylase, PgdA/CDA1 family [Klenkia brasiliensis]
MDRRRFLATALAGGAAVLAGCSTGAGTAPQAAPTTTPPRPTTTAPTTTPSPTFPAPQLTRVPVPPGKLTGLPGEGSLLAWTVDDGDDSSVVRAYTEFGRDTGTRLTFFLNGSKPAWTENADLLRPLVADGRIQLGNHTWSHADLTSLSTAGIQDELQRNHDFVQATYGVDMRPYYRPPYGYRNAATDAAAAAIGYTCPVLWYGSLSDSALITPEALLGFADQWFLPQHIVIGHLNFTPVTTVFPQLHQLVVSRGLTTVTLDDVFLPPTS